MKNIVHFSVIILLLFAVSQAQTLSNVEQAVRYRVVQNVSSDAGNISQANSAITDYETAVPLLVSKSASQLEELGSRYGFVKSDAQLQELGSRYGFVKSDAQLQELGSRYGFVKSDAQLQELGSRYGFVKSDAQLQELGSRYGFVK